MGPAPPNSLRCSSGAARHSHFEAERNFRALRTKAKVARRARHRWMKTPQLSRRDDGSWRTPRRSFVAARGQQPKTREPIPHPSQATHRELELEHSNVSDEMEGDGGTKQTKKGIQAEETRDGQEQRKGKEYRERNGKCQQGCFLTATALRECWTDGVSTARSVHR